MTTPAAKTIERLPLRLSNAPIHNYIARERRLERVAEKLFETGITTVQEFLVANETGALLRIRMTHENRKRIGKLLELFGVETPACERSGSPRRRHGSRGPSHA